jgi:Spy/CpxP family protein refolding chaperone
MSRLIRSAALACAALAVFAAAPRVHAQGGFGAFTRILRPYHHTTLAGLTEVEAALKLTDEQKTKRDELYDKLMEERGTLFQGFQDDPEGTRVAMNKLHDDVAKELNDALDETQRKRLAEIFVQTNGGTALFDGIVAGELKLTDEQKTKLNDLRNDSFGSFQDYDWQNMDEEEADKAVTEVLAKQDTDYLGTLTDEQKAAFEKLKGEKLEVDLKKLPSPFGG